MIEAERSTLSRRAALQGGTCRKRGRRPILKSSQVGRTGFGLASGLMHFSNLTLSR
jgi:hypothetical protein